MGCDKGKCCEAVSVMTMYDVTFDGHLPAYLWDRCQEWNLGTRRCVMLSSGNAASPCSRRVVPLDPRPWGVWKLHFWFLHASSFCTSSPKIHSCVSTYFFSGVDNYSQDSPKKGYDQEENGDRPITTKLF